MTCERQQQRLRFAGGCALVVLMALGGGIGQARAGGNIITPDGHTRTQLSTSGTTTTVSTRTISGGNAFNSFRDFSVGTGHTVNLKVPSTAGNLVNLVHASPVEINGVLNSYKNGKIGGNVYFADPYGLVVGKTGVVNMS